MQTNIDNVDKFFAEVEINDAVERLKNQVEMETWRRAEEMVVMKASMVEKLLHSNEAYNIRSLSFGEKFVALQNIRNRLFIRLKVLYEIESMCHEEWRKAARK